MYCVRDCYVDEICYFPVRQSVKINSKQINGSSKQTYESHCKQQKTTRIIISQARRQVSSIITCLHPYPGLYPTRLLSLLQCTAGAGYIEIAAAVQCYYTDLPSSCCRGNIIALLYKPAPVEYRYVLFQPDSYTIPRSTTTKYCLTASHRSKIARTDFFVVSRKGNFFTRHLKQYLSTTP